MFYDSLDHPCSIVDAARPDQSNCMLNEGCLFSNLSHPNVLSVLAVCTDSPQPMIIYSYMEQGNLKQFLLKSQISDLHTHIVSSIDINHEGGIIIWE